MSVDSQRARRHPPAPVIGGALRGATCSLGEDRLGLPVLVLDRLYLTASPTLERDVRRLRRAGWRVEVVSIGARVWRIHLKGFADGVGDQRLT